MAAPRPLPSLRALVARAIDYAGLFPPAGLSMADAVARYADHLGSSESWMLGRFVVPASRLSELAGAAAAPVTSAAQPWRLSVLLDDPTTDARRIGAFSANHGTRFIIEAVEGRASTANDVASMLGAFAPSLERYVELPHGDDARALIESVGHAGGRAKIRTGGVTPAAFPSTAAIARFIVRFAESAVVLKATAGLHHAVGGDYRLTYEPGAARAPMFGFLNLFAASVLAADGLAEDVLIRMLEERDGRAIAFDDDGMRWRDHVVPITRIVHARHTLVAAFGSCSFDEPRDDLRALGLL